MADVLNCERLQGMLAPHELSDPGKLGQAGFVIKKESLLCASSHRAQSFWAPGASHVAFRAELDGRNQVSYREWIPITQQEYERLAPLKEPLTGEPHVLFAWMPLPQKQGHTLPTQSSSEATKTVSPDEVAQQLKQLSQKTSTSGQPTQDLLDVENIPPSTQNESQESDSKKTKSKKSTSSSSSKTKKPAEKQEVSDTNA